MDVEARSLLHDIADSLLDDAWNQNYVDVDKDLPIAVIKFLTKFIVNL